MLTENRTPPDVEEEAIFQNVNGLGKNKNMVMGPDGAGNQD
jgi:hypothetical protein